MKKFFCIFLILLVLVGCLPSCNKTNTEENTITDSPILLITEPPIIQKIPKASIVFVFLENDKDVFQSLYHQLAYIKMESAGYTISSVYTNESEDLQSVFSQLEANGTEYVVATSRQIDTQIDTYKRNNNSDIIFTSCSDSVADSYLTYQTKLYEYYYLAGVALCSQSQSKIAGFVANSSDEQTIRCINAFALGMKAMDANAKVVVSWTEQPQDENSLLQIVTELSTQNCDVFGYFMPSDLVEKSFNSINAPYMTMSTHTFLNIDSNIAIKPVINLDKYFYNVMNIEKTSLEFGFSYLGIQNETLGYELSDNVSADTQDAVLSAHENIQTGYEVFSGPIYSKLSLIVPEGISLPVEDILDMLWFVENVVGDLPAG